VETLDTTGSWFKSRFDLTPATAFMALKDWKDEGRQSLWFDSCHYRINLLWENGELWIRDLHLFDETYAERYLAEVCTTPNCLYDTLPVVDGNLWAAGPERTGLRFVQIPPSGVIAPLHGGIPEVFEEDLSTLRVSWPLQTGGKLDIYLFPNGMRGTTGGVDWGLQCSGMDIGRLTLSDVHSDRMDFVHEGHGYSVHCKCGNMVNMRKGSRLFARAASGCLDLCMTKSCSK